MRTISPRRAGFAFEPAHRVAFAAGSSRSGQRHQGQRPRGKAQDAGESVAVAGSMEQAPRSCEAAPSRDYVRVSHRYALAAAATGQLSLAASWAHREICLRVAMNAHAHKRRAHLAVYYDQAQRAACARDALLLSLCEFARSMWAERTRAGEHDFNAEKAAVKFSSWVLRQEGLGRVAARGQLAMLLRRAGRGCV